MGLMDKMEACYGMGNVKHAKAFLKELWIAKDNQAGEQNDIHWDKFLGTFSFTALLA